jgi:hypothetical protein
MATIAARRQTRSKSADICRFLALERLEDRSLMAVDFAWAQSMGTSEFSEQGHDVAVDNAGGVYALYRAADSNGVLRTNVTKYDSATKAVVWSQPIGLASQDVSVHSGSLTVAGGSVYVAGDQNDNIFIASLSAATGSLNWSREYNSTRNLDDAARAVAVGADGVYIAGYFTESIDLGGVVLTGPVYNSPDFLTEGFLAKLDPATGDTLAAVTLNSADASVGDQKMGLAMDGSSLVLAAGSVFARFDGDLNLVQRQTWAAPVYETSGVGAKDVAIDSLGNIVITGSFQGTVDLDPGPGTATFTSVPKKGSSVWNPASGPSLDTFVLKLQSDGAVAWVRALGGGGADFPFSLALDSLGNVYTTGSFQQKVDFDPGAGQFTLTSQPTNLSGTNDGYISILNANGAFVWAGAIVGDSNLIDGDAGVGIAVDSQFSIYVTGVFTESADLNPGKSKYTVKSRGGQDPFLLKLTQSGLVAPSQSSLSQSSLSQTTADSEDELWALLADEFVHRRRSAQAARALLELLNEPIDEDTLAVLAEH